MAICNKDSGIKPFSGTNFSNWSFRVKSMLEHNGVEEWIDTKFDAATHTDKAQKQGEKKCKFLLIK